MTPVEQTNLCNEILLPDSNNICTLVSKDIEIPKLSLKEKIKKFLNSLVK